MTRIRRGGYIFVLWRGDHDPRHVHVFKDARLLGRWNLDADCLMSGCVPPSAIDLIRALSREGKL